LAPESQTACSDFGTPNIEEFLASDVGGAMTRVAGQPSIEASQPEL
jgi:hypothetical protein